MFDRLRLYLKYDIYNHRETGGLFLGAVRKNMMYHRKHCDTYHTILCSKGFHVNDVKGMKDLADIPFLTTQYLKRHRIMSMNLNRLPIKAASSGTGGMQSFVGINMKALIYAGIMTVRMISYHKLFSWRPTNYVVLGYEPHKSNITMIGKTQRATTFFAPPIHKAYALKYRNGGYGIDYEGMKSALKCYAKQKAPVRLVGVPAHAFFLLRQLKQEHISYRLPKGSMVLLGGGWKEFYQEQVEKEVLYRLLEEVLGISEENCREFFGVTEHPVLYCSCTNNHFHVPNYSRVIIRDIRTLLPVKNGEIGLVNLLTPVADSMPLVSIMTDDLGILRAGEECGCGIGTPYLELTGRAGVKEIKTCAVDAADYLRNGYRDGKSKNKGN